MASRVGSSVSGKVLAAALSMVRSSVKLFLTAAKALSWPSAGGVQSRTTGPFGATGGGGSLGAGGGCPIAERLKTDAPRRQIVSRDICFMFW